MIEETHEINFAADLKMVAFSDEVLGAQAILDDVLRARGRLYRRILAYIKEHYHVSWETHMIDCYELKLKPRIKEDT